MLCQFLHAEILVLGLVPLHGGDVDIFADDGEGLVVAAAGGDALAHLCGFVTHSAALERPRGYAHEVEYVAIGPDQRLIPISG